MPRTPPRRAFSRGAETTISNVIRDIFRGWVFALLIWFIRGICPFAGHASGYLVHSNIINISLHECTQFFRTWVLLLRLLLQIKTLFFFHQILPFPCQNSSIQHAIEITFIKKKIFLKLIGTHLAQWQKSIKSNDFIVKKSFALDEYKLYKDFFLIKVISIDAWKCFNRGMAGFNEKNRILASTSHKKHFIL